MSRRRILLANQTQGGGGFSPLDLSPNLWLDATDATTITEVSGDVSQWNDKSGNGNNVSQSVSTNRPSNGGTLNGNNVIDWGSTTNSKLLILNGGANADNWQDVYIVGKWDDGDTTFGSGSGVFCASSSSGTSAGIGLIGASNNSYFFSSLKWYNNLYLNELPISSNQAVLGVTNTIANAFHLSFSSNNPIGVFGITLGSFNLNTTNNGWRGVIGEVVAFPRKLSDTERGQMNTYLKNKWGL